MASFARGQALQGGEGSAAAAGGPAARFGRSLAVVIGIDTYGEGISPLQSAVADATAVAEALERDHGFETWCLLEDAARLPDLLTLLHGRLPSALGPDDRLVFYFAGHGIALDGDRGPAGYLIPAGARRFDPGGFLRMHDLHGALSSLPVRHALVILDCCFAGTFRWSSLRDVEPAVAPIYRERYDRYVEGAAWQVLTSASGAQLALDLLANDRDESPARHSPFARALLEGLRGGADYTQDHLVTADELALFVRERVAPYADAAGQRQVPQLFLLDRHDDGQFVFQVPGRAVNLMPAPPLDEAANPYRGLRSFREQDRALFFGRDAAVERLLGAVAAQRLTVVTGPSGCGKSSLVQAGLVPALRAHGWTVLPPQRPGREPLAALGALTRAVRAEPVEIDPVAAWRTAIAEHERARPGQPWLVIIDQLEELVTHCTAERDRALFLGALAFALEAAPALHVVVTVRADVEPQLHDSALAPWWTAARFVVPGMSRDELRDAIAKPALAAVLHFEPSRLVERLIDDVALVPAPLPLLSFALSELYRRCWARWQAGACDRALREADYDDMGSVARALTQRATALYDQLVVEDAAYGSTIRNVVSRMVAIVGGERARCRVILDELDYDDPAEDRRVAEVLQRFHDARLISLGTEKTEDGGTVRYAEPTHDELVRGWTQVSRWLDEVDNPTGTRALLGALGGAVASWQAGKQASSLLWTDPRVELVDKLVRDQPWALNAREARFVRRSVRLRRDRRRQLLSGLLAVLAVLAAAAGIALWQRGIAVESAERAARNARAEQDARRSAVAARGDAEQQSRRATAEATRATAEAARATAEAARATANQELAAEKEAEASRQRDRAVAAKRANQRLLARAYQESGRQLLLDGRPFEAVPYLVAARRAGEAGASLRMLFSAATRLLPLSLQHRSTVWRAVFSPDGMRIVTASIDGTARVWDAATGKPLAPPLRHRGDVNGAAFSRDGTRVLTTSSDGTARVWDAATGKPLTPPLQHRRPVWSAAFSPDGTRVVTASYDTTARVWDAATGEPLTASLPHRGSVVTAAFSPDGTRILTTSRDHAARVWDVATGEPLTPPLQHRGDVNSAVFSPDGTRVVTASSDKTARVWNVTTGELVTWLSGHRKPVVSAAFSPDGMRVVTASSDNTARVWDATTGKPLTPPLQHQRLVTSAGFSPDGTRVVTASNDSTARVWDAATGEPLTPPLEHAGAVRRVAFSPDGERVVTASDDGTARVWDAAAGKPLTPPLEHAGAVWSAAFSPDGTRVVTTSGDLARVWVVATGKLPARPLQHAGAVWSAAFSRDGTRVITASSDHTARIWDAGTGKPLAPPLQHEDSVSSAAFSPDGTRVVTASDPARVWDVATGKPLTPPLRHHDDFVVLSAAFSPDSTHVVTASADGTARVRDAATGKPLTPPLQHEGPVTSAAFSPDGTRVVTAGRDRIARIWNATTGRPVSPALEHHPDFVGGVSSVAFSPDGTRVVTAGHDHTARIWDAATGKLLTLPLQHQGSVWSAAFSTDGTRIVTASRDKTARVWDASTGEPLTPPLQHQDQVRSAAFSPDGTCVVTASHDKTAQIWDAATGKLLAPPLQHQGSVWSASFSPGGTRIVTASEDEAARLWEIPLAPGTLADWSAIAERSPYVLVNGVLSRRL